ncbi:MAG: hypothetical protein GX160_03010 [Clostridiales bacterium]|nr:hypothetical protein [Clostridiales bacterium]
MAEIIKTYRQSVPAMRFIGKKYEDKDRVNGGFAKQWEEWFSNGWFEVLEKRCIQKLPMKTVMHMLGLCVGKRESPLSTG